MSPFGSDDPSPEKLHVLAVQFGVPITGIGATFVTGWATVTMRVALAEAPHPSVTVNVTV